MLKGFSMKVKGARISGMGLKGLRVQGPKLRPEGTRQTSGVCRSGMYTGRVCFGIPFRILTNMKYIYGSPPELSTSFGVNTVYSPPPPTHSLKDYSVCAYVYPLNPSICVCVCV